MFVRLFTSCYPERDPVRREEIRQCLRRNADCDLLDQICLFVEGPVLVPVDSEKVQIREAAERPRYLDFFAWANQLAGPQDISIVANSDIFFSDTLAALFESLTENSCAALSRWDIMPQGPPRLFDRADSQDVWVFRGQIRPMISDFCVGIPRCDNRILYELQQAGYRVINPAFSVQAFHLHAGQRAEYPGQIQGLHVSPPYAYLYPHNLWNLPQTLLHNLRHPHRRIGWRPDWRRLKRWSPVSCATPGKGSSEACPRSGAKVNPRPATATVGIVIPHFNRSKLLKATLNSLSQQTCNDWQAVVVDDGSCPEEWLAIQPYRTERISIIRREDGLKGPSRCRNLGWRQLQTPYVVFLDSDDLLAPWCLEERLKLANQQPLADAWVFPVMLFQHTPGDTNVLWNQLHGPDDLLRFLRSDPPWHTSSPLWKRSALEQLNGFNERVMYGDDADLHIRGLMQGTVFAKTPHTLPDAFVRRADQERITNTLSETLLDSRLTRLRELTPLVRSHGTPLQQLTWQGQYFVECEFLLFRLEQSATGIQAVLQAWKHDWTAERHSRAIASGYLQIARLCRRQAYLALRIARRIAKVLLPRPWFPAGGQFEAASLDDDQRSALKEKLSAAQRNWKSLP